MALINCPECNREISSSAATCPGCGTPIAAAADTLATGTQTTTIQETAKKFKLHLLGAWALFIGGWIWIFKAVGAAKDGIEPPGYVGLPVVIGFLWWVVTKFRIWWHHR